MIEAIEALRGATGQGKTLAPLPMEEIGELDEFIADRELLDPDRPEQLFEPMGKHGLAKSWARGRASIAARLHRGRRGAG